MNKSFFIVIFLFLLSSCSEQTNSTADKKLDVADTVSNKKPNVADSLIITDSIRRVAENKRLQLNIFEAIVGKWVFVKSFLPKGSSIDEPSFTIIRANIESAGYAYFVRFSEDEQEFILSKQDWDTVTYGDYGYGTFRFDPSTGHLFVKISDTSNAEYQKSN